MLLELWQNSWESRVTWGHFHGDLEHTVDTLRHCYKQNTDVQHDNHRLSIKLACSYKYFSIDFPLKYFLMCMWDSRHIYCTKCMVMLVPGHSRIMVENTRYTIIFTLCQPLNCRVWLATRMCCSSKVIKYASESVKVPSVKVSLVK